MIPILVCCHGGSAPKLVETAEMIAGKQDVCESVEFLMGESLDKLKGDIKTKLSKLNNPNDVLCLVDLKGGTPFNVLVQMTEDYPGLDIVTGVNIPMLLQTFIQRPSSVSKEELMNSIIDAAHKGIYEFEKEPSVNDSDEEF